MNSTKHANIRMRQRGIPLEIASLIYRFGSSLPARDGAVKKTIRKKDLAWIKGEIPDCNQLLDKALGRHLVMTGNESRIITAY